MKRLTVADILKVAGNSAEFTIRNNEYLQEVEFIVIDRDGVLETYLGPRLSEIGYRAYLKFLDDLDSVANLINMQLTRYL